MSPKEQVKALSEQVVEMVNKGDLDGAKTSLNNVTIPEEFQKKVQVMLRSSMTPCTYL